MGFKEVIQKIRGLDSSVNERKELMRRMDNEMRVQQILTERQKSANERELERYYDEEREKTIKEELEDMRKKRDYDIKFNHNPLNVKNITNHTDWEVLRERNMFKGGKATIIQKGMIHKNNPKLLKNNMKLLR